MFRRSGRTPLIKGALVVTACFPLPQRIKTSLQDHLTTTQSKALYRRFLLDILETTQDVEGMDLYLAYTPRGSRKALENIVPTSFSLLCQEGGSVGDRFSNLSRRLMRDGYERVLILCSNHPDLPSCMLHQAVESLERKRVDVVFGPNERGGFYLVGLKSHRPELFPEIDWEGPGIERQISQWARSRQIRLHRLPSWYDIHTIEDLRRYYTYYRLRKDSRANSRSQAGRYLSHIQERILAPTC